jgi:hypothetical protein
LIGVHFSLQFSLQFVISALAQCMCHVMAGSDTAFARIQRQAPSEPGESSAYVFGVSSSAVRILPFLHLALST